MKLYLPKAIKNIAKAVACLFVLCLVLGAVYVYFIDKTPNRPTRIVQPSSDAASPLPPPTKPGTNSPEGVAIEALTSPVQLGAVFYLSAETNAGSECSLIISFPGEATTTPGPSAQYANTYGNVTWSWTVPKTLATGTWPLTVTCLYNGRTGVATANVQMTE